jgi:hypothetical protein
MAHGTQSATDARAILQYLDTVLLDVRDVVAGAPRRRVDRRAAASLLQPPTSRLPRKGRSSPRKIGGIFANGLPHLARFQAKWKPVRVKKTRQIKNLEPRFDSIEAEKALAAAAKFSTAPR